MTSDSPDRDAAASMIMLAQACHPIIQFAIDVEAMLNIDLDDGNAIGKAVRAKEMGAPLLWAEIHQFELKRKPNWPMTVQQVQAHYEKRLAVIPDVVAVMDKAFHAVRDVLERSLLRLTPSPYDSTFGTETASTMSEAVLNFGERILQEIPDSDIVRMERRRDEFRIEKETGVPVDRSNLLRFLEFRKRLSEFEPPVLKSIERQIKREFQTLSTAQIDDDSSRSAEVESVKSLAESATVHSDTDGDVDAPETVEQIASKVVQLVEQKLNPPPGNQPEEVRLLAIAQDKCADAEVKAWLSELYAIRRNGKFKNLPLTFEWLEKHFESDAEDVPNGLQGYQLPKNRGAR
jgi:hypothetical protein